jgi:hypothetical protein
MQTHFFCDVNSWCLVNSYWKSEGGGDWALKNVNSHHSVTSRISETAATLLYEPHTLHH